MTAQSAVVATTLWLSMFVGIAMPVTTPAAAVEQTPAAMDVSRLVGTWAGDKKANEKAFQAGLITQENGLRISQVNDALVVTSIFRRAPGGPWQSGDTLSYNLDGSLSPTVFHGQSATTTLAREGDALTMTVARVTVPGTRGTPTPNPGNALQAMRMFVDGDRLKVDWYTPIPGAASTLFFDREQPAVN